MKKTSENKTGCIYMIKNKTNGKIYIGQTQQNPKYRFSQHQSSKQELGFDMRSFGIDNFELTVLKDNVDVNDLHIEEANFIHEYSQSYELYNISMGNIYMIPIFSRDYKGSIKHYKNITEAVEYMVEVGEFTEYDGGAVNDLKRRLFLSSKETRKKTIYNAIINNITRKSHSALNRSWSFAEEHDFLDFVKKNKEIRDGKRAYYKEPGSYLGSRAKYIMDDDYNPNAYKEWVVE